MECRSEESVELYLQSFSHLHDVVLNSVQEELYFYHSVALPHAKGSSKLCKPEVTTSDTLPRKWNNFRTCFYVPHYMYIPTQLL
jgi:hypothetical protein